MDVENCQKGGDWWPRMVMLKVIQQYYTATKDPRVIPFMTHYFKYQYAALNRCGLGQWTEWAESRGSENIKMVLWLYGQTRETWLLDLATEIESQSFPWTNYLGNRNWAINASVNPDGRAWMTRHGVNVGMGIKVPALNYQRTGDRRYLDSLKTGFTDIMTLHGLPNGIYSADEDLHGNSPAHGTELCATVETMYSLETAISITGDPFYMDALERATFNALPPQTTEDYNEKQYFQMANQVEIDRGVYAFTLPFDRGMNNVFGAKSGYTCCYANMHQGFTKFATHLWYETRGNGVAALVYSPNEFRAQVGPENQTVKITEDTQYPFESKVRFRFEIEKDIQFPFEFRIPGWCESPRVKLNGRPLKLPQQSGIVTIDRIWQNSDELVLDFPDEVRVSSWAENSKTIEYGPLVFGLKLSEIWGWAEEEAEGKYYTLHTTDHWNFGVPKDCVENPSENIELIKKKMPAHFKWNQESAPLELRLKAKQVLDWKAINGVPHLPVTGREGHYKGAVADELQTISLIPIGFTRLRIVAFPVVK